MYTAFVRYPSESVYLGTFDSIGEARGAFADYCDLVDEYGAFALVRTSDGESVRA